MNISVIIPTFNGAHKIEAALTALSQQTFPDFEVVIIIDGSTDNTQDVIKRFDGILPRMSVHFIENRGRAHAKNEGVNASKGEILIFIDDDIRLFKDAVELHRNFHLENQNEIMFGHLEMDPEKARLNDFWNYRRTIESGWRELQSTTISYANYGITSANLSLTKKTFWKVGEFDSTLRDSEDFDFGIRALQQGIPIRYIPKINGYHDDFSTLLPYVRRQKEYMMSKYVLLKKHPEYKKILPNHFKWSASLSGDGIKKFFFGNENRWEPLFESKVFLSLPQSLRYKLYSAYIYVHSVMMTRPAA
ncbi:MAG: glycosyltransferase [Cyclobacteriaceae bacterium]|nr:glycosyltransferase [Cyclobacteriaceae bacterium]